MPANRWKITHPDRITGLMLGVLGLVAIVAIILLVASRNGELFCLSVRDAQIMVVRGRIPKMLLSDFREVARHEAIERATIRGVMDGGAARLLVSGVDDGVVQQLRNTFGVHHISKLKNAAKPQNRNLGQILGIAWLAWLLFPATKN